MRQLLVVKHRFHELEALPFWEIELYGLSYLIFGLVSGGGEEALLEVLGGRLRAEVEGEVAEEPHELGEGGGGVLGVDHFGEVGD